MRILNVMFGKKLGSIEQMFLDYNQALNIQKVDVVPVIHPKALVRKYIAGHYYTVSNFSTFDPFAMLKIRKLVMEVQPNLIITHSKRANKLVRFAIKNVPVVGIAHGYKCKTLIGSEAIIAPTEDIKNTLIAAGQPEGAVFVIPHMLRISSDTSYVKPRRFDVPVIATLSRLNKVNGIDIFLKSLSILKKKGVKFNAKIAGYGEERKALERLSVKLGLSDNVEFLSWIEEKSEFFSSIDIFCFPSKSESFDLALLEAMVHSKPIVTSNGGSIPQLVGEMKGALVIEHDNPEAAAAALEKLINNRKLCDKISKEAFVTAQDYSIYTVSRSLKLTLEEIYYNSINNRYTTR